MDQPRPLFAYPKYWAAPDIAPFLPMSRHEMTALGWDSCDVIIVTGDAYVDHPSFGMAIIGRLLEAQGFRVGIIAQPEWRSKDAFMALGRPNLFFGITAGNMDSLVNHYTADRRLRSDDAYTPHGVAGKRPDRALLVYANRCREAYPDVPLVLGGIEASLRRLAHFDYWSEKVRQSILIDARADLLVYGNGERQVVDIAHRLGRNENVHAMIDVRGTAFVAQKIADGWEEIDQSAPEASETAIYTRRDKRRTVIRLPSCEQVIADNIAYARAVRLYYLESNPGNARALAQPHGKRLVWVNPPALPLVSEELDAVHELPYAFRPHPAYGDAKIPAFDMIKTSVAIVRGCFGGCTFCSLAAHEGRIVQNRSEGSVLRQLETIRDKVPGFSGIISDLGGPTANMYRIGCRDTHVQAQCRRLSCLYPQICGNLRHDHAPLIALYRKARQIPGIKKVCIGSGIRYDLAVISPDYIRELTAHHVSGQLKIAPEHSESGPLAHMMKPGIASFENFAELFARYSREAGKEQYLLPYLIAAHPGTTDADMLALALWLKRHNFRIDQVQTFTPTPMSIATAMYHSGHNPLAPLDGNHPVAVPQGLSVRRLHKAFLRYHDADNWPLLREALTRMGRADLIGHGPQALVPPETPAVGRPGPRKDRRRGR